MHRVRTLALAATLLAAATVVCAAISPDEPRGGGESSSVSMCADANCSTVVSAAARQDAATQPEKRIDEQVAALANEHGLKPAALQGLLERADETESDALIIIKNGQTVIERYYNKPVGPIESMSATKSIVALAFGRLLADGRLKSLDEPVHTFYPEWRQGRKRDITIRHLLTQRSGLQANPRTHDIYASPDFVQLALCAELTDTGRSMAIQQQGLQPVGGHRREGVRHTHGCAHRQRDL